MTEKKCARCGYRGSKPPCDGTGTTLKVGKSVTGHEVTNVIPCPGVRVMHFRDRVGPEIFKAPTTKDTPLYQKGGEDLTRKHLHIVAELPVLWSHLKYVLWEKGDSFFYRSTYDSQLCNAWLGQDSQYDNMSEIVVGPDLLVILLGIQGYRNVALPAQILEALRVRVLEGAPVWVVTSPYVPLGEGHIAWSQSLENYMREHLRVVSLSAPETASTKTNTSGKKDEPKATKSRFGGYF